MWKETLPIGCWIQNSTIMFKSTYPIVSAVIENREEQITIEDLSNKNIFKSGKVILSHHNEGKEHLHFLHECPGYTARKGCSCNKSRSIRSLGFSIKSKECTDVDNYAAYLKTPPRKIVLAHDNGVDLTSKVYELPDNTETYHCCEKFTIEEQLKLLITKNLFKGELEAMENYEIKQLFIQNKVRSIRARKELISHSWQLHLLDWINKPLHEVLQTTHQLYLIDKDNYLPLKESMYVALKLIGQTASTATLIVERLSYILRLLRGYDVKRNAIVIWGESNSGKSLFWKSLCRALHHVGSVEIDDASQFAYSDCPNKRLIFMEEAPRKPANIQMLKQILEGGCPKVNVKYCNKMEIPKVPVVILSNHDWISEINDVPDRVAIRSRCVVSKWSKQEWLINFKGQINPAIWKWLFTMTPETVEDILKLNIQYGEPVNFKSSENCYSDYREMFNYDDEINSVLYS